MRHFIDQPLWRGATTSVAEKIKDIHQAWTRNDSLITHVAEADTKVVEQFHFELITRGEIAMTTLARENMVL